MNLEGKRVLVTGGAGFIGSHVIDQLLSEGVASVVAIDNLGRGRRENLAAALKSGRVTLYEADIRDRVLMDELVSQSNLVFHHAALRITQCASEPRQAIEVMIDATFDLFEACVKHEVEKVVAASSASVYGMADAFPTPESHHPYNNHTLYGAAKTFNEGLLRSFHQMYGLDYVALRFFNVYGPRMDIHGVYTEVLVRWMERIATGERPVIFGDGSQTMDFVYIDDVARANICAAKSDASDGAFNVASGTETSLKELAGLLSRVMESDTMTEHREERKVNPVRRRLADITAARDQLEFEAAVPLRTACADS
jgi:UDP-glucose 4-epimerase